MTMSHGNASMTDRTRQSPSDSYATRSSHQSRIQKFRSLGVSQVESPRARRERRLGSPSKSRHHSTHSSQDLNSSSSDSRDHHRRTSSSLSLSEDESNFDVKTVRVSYRVHRISDISAEQQTFYCEFRVTASWCDESCLGKKTHEIDWKSVWTPRIVVSDQEHLEEVFTGCPFHSHKPQGEAGCNLSFSMLYRGTVFVNLHLRDFPFDQHALPICIRSGFPVKMGDETDPDVKVQSASVFHGKQTLVKFVDDSAHENIMRTDFQLDEWNIAKISRATRLSDPSYSSSGKIYSEYIAQVFVKRNHEFYTFNSGSIIVLIVLMTTSTFFVDTKFAQGRMMITLTSLFSLMVFNFAVKANLPNVPYQTAFDKFMMLSYLFLVIASIENVAVRKITNVASGVATVVDRIMMGLFPLAYLLTCMWLVRHSLKKRQADPQRLRAHAARKRHLAMGGLASVLKASNNFRNNAGQTSTRESSEADGASPSQPIALSPGVSGSAPPAQK